jgi:hypothetical protein
VQQAPVQHNGTADPAPESAVKPGNQA